MNESVALTSSVALVGSCVEGTRWTSSVQSRSVGTLHVDSGAQARVANLSLSGQRPAILAMGRGTNLQVADVDVGEASIGVASVGEAVVQVDRVYVHDTNAMQGVVAEYSAVVRGVGLTVDRATAEALSIGASAVELDDLLVAFGLQRFCGFVALIERGADRDFVHDTSVPSITVRRMSLPRNRPFRRGAPAPGPNRLD